MRARLLVGLALGLLACNKPVEPVAPTEPPLATKNDGTHDETEPSSPACAAPEGGWYLHLSDVHLGAEVEAQQPGGDTSVRLWAATKAQLRERIDGPNPPAFILYTGDLPDHAPDRGEPHTHNIQTVLGDLHALAGKTPLLYLPGNNDSLDWDYASFTNAAKETALSVSGWSGPTLNIPSRGNARLGYYSAVPVPGLRVIALNTVIMSASYPCAHQQQTPGTCANQQDVEANEQLAWLDDELEAAGLEGEKVLLAMHIPPGIDAYQSPKLMWKDQAWQDQLLAQIAASPAEIVGLAFGHTHLDELRRLYNGAQTLETLAISAPGITPGHGNNPGFKAVSYDADFRLTDSLTWYATAPDPEAPVYAYADAACYRYSEVFDCQGQSLSACLGAREVCALAESMATIYTVKHGAPSYATAPGIDVHVGGVAPATCPAARY